MTWSFPTRCCENRALNWPNLVAILHLTGKPTNPASYPIHPLPTTISSLKSYHHLPLLAVVYTFNNVAEKTGVCLLDVLLRGVDLKSPFYNLDELIIVLIIIHSC